MKNEGLGFWKQKGLTINLVPVKIMKKLKSKLFKVFRPYCSPAVVIVKAFDKVQAIKLTNNAYGFVGDAKAQIINPGKIGVIVGFDNQISPRDWETEKAINKF